MQGFESSVKWYSSSANNISQQATDLEHMRYVVDNDAYRSSRETWLCSLVRAKNKIVVRRVAAEGQAAPSAWMMPLIEIPNSATFVWPLEEVFVEGIEQPFFKFVQKIRHLSAYIFPVTDLSKLEVVCKAWALSCWRAPLRAKALKCISPLAGDAHAF